MAYRPRIQNCGVDWGRLVELVSLIRETSKAQVVQEALASYCEASISAELQENSPIPHEMLEVELGKIKAFLRSAD